MKICLVSSFPPSRRGLNEYGFHIARELQRNPLLSLTVLADELASPQPELPGYSVIRCWDFNRLPNPLCILREVRKIQPDIVWFNLGFATFGNSAAAASLGLTTPALVETAGFKTHVTLHQLMDTVDLDDAGVRFKTLYKIAGYIITRILLMSDSTSVLLPAYRRILVEKYGSEDVHVRPHGILSGRPEYPSFAARGNPHHRILAFGKWGTYKRLEPLLKAFYLISQQFPEARLVVAGGNHPNTPGYVESVAERCKGDHRIEFTGYVPEERIPDLFRSATLTILPYTSSAGASGVAHLASQYGVPMVASNISDFLQLSEDEGLAIEFFHAGDVEDMAGASLRVLQSPQLQQEMALQNFSVALRMTMPRVIREYLRSFDLRDRVESLRAFSRLRRVPRWVPFRAAIANLMMRKHAGWRSAIPAPHLLQHEPDSPLENPGASLSALLQDLNQTSEPNGAGRDGQKPKESGILLDASADAINSPGANSILRRRHHGAANHDRSDAEAPSDHDPQEEASLCVPTGRREKLTERYARSGNHDLDVA